MEIERTKFCLNMSLPLKYVFSEIEQITLTPLEIELRDELRKIGDDMDAKVR